MCSRKASDLEIQAILERAAAAPLATDGRCLSKMSNKRTYQASCHCGAVRFRFRSDEITKGCRCNCSICTASTPRERSELIRHKILSNGGGSSKQPLTGVKRRRCAGERGDARIYGV
jgi:hypothetical protein